MDNDEALDRLRFITVIDCVFREKHNSVWACDPPVDYSKLIQLLKKSGKSVFVFVC